MAIIIFVAVIFGLCSILLSLENDRLRKHSLRAKKEEEDRLYKLSVIKEIQEKIAYITDPEKVVDLIMASLRNFLSYSVVSSMTTKDEQVIFKIYIEDDIGPAYLEKVEEGMRSSFEKLVGKLPARVEKKLYGVPVNNAAKAIYSSSFHLPLIANNKVLALIHLSSTLENAYSNMEDLHELMDAVSGALTHFRQAVNLETEKLSSLITGIDEGIFMTDNKNNLLFINESAKTMLGLSEKADFFDILNVFPPDVRLGAKINEVILSKKPHSEKEIQVKNKTLSMTINHAGNDRITVVLHDLSDYKKKELQKDELTQIMVHELRSPVTTIKDSAELIIRTGDALEKDKQLKFLEIIHQQAKKILGQIGLILDADKLDAGKLVLQKTTGDIAKLINDEVQTFMPQAQKKNITLNFEILAKSVPKISFDQARISQAIDNLLSNSLKFTPEEGRIKVELDYRTVPPDVGDTAPGEEFLSLDLSSTFPSRNDTLHTPAEKVLDKYVVVSVSDNGVGIAPEQQKLLFSKYIQAKNTPEQFVGLGTGLGLYLARGIIESHGGRIWVKSAVGQGTTFSFTLPAIDNAQGLQVASKSATTPLAKLSQTVN